MFSLFSLYEQNRQRLPALCKEYPYARTNWPSLLVNAVVKFSKIYHIYLRLSTSSLIAIVLSLSVRE
jgi:hypothetical protein